MRPTEQLHRQALAAHGDRLARYLDGRITADEWRPLRLSYGLYYQLDHTSHMQRIKIAGGVLTASQLEAIADVADRYGRGVGHVTTRQDIQIHWVPLERIMDVYDRLLAVGITTRGACADTVRNVTCCPYAGVSPDEPFNVFPYCLAIHEYFLFNPLNLTLPRKFKIAVEGCPLDCAQIPVNDIGLYAKVDQGVEGFAVWAGGGLGSQPFLARHLRDFIPAADVLVWCEAIVRVQHRYGERKNRHKARMKYVVQKMGLERFRSTVEAEVARVDAERGAELRAQVRTMVAEHRVSPLPDAHRQPAPEAPGFARWRRTNTRPQRQPGYRSAIVELPLGDITTAQMRAVARLVREHGDGTLCCTNDQNIVLPSVPDAALPALFAALLQADLASPDAGSIHDVVSCPGMDYCSLAITRSMGMADRLRAALMDDPATGDGFAERLGPFGIKISGCPNSCGQHNVGDIGLTGHAIKADDGTETPYYSVLVGGSVGEGRGRVGKRIGRWPEAQTPIVVAAVARFYERERHAGESFAVFCERVGAKRLGEVADGAVGPGAEA
ncbi:MAG: nitrite/sulfite reductase [Candidatus Binatia bacterium]